MLWRKGQRTKAANFRIYIHGLWLHRRGIRRLGGGFVQRVQFSLNVGMFSTTILIEGKVARQAVGWFNISFVLIFFALVTQLML